MKRCIRYPNWACPRAKPEDNINTMLNCNFCKDCTHGETMCLQDAERIFCPNCREDVDSEAGEFLMVSGEPTDIMRCPHCGAKLRVKISVDLVQE